MDDLKIDAEILRNILLSLNIDPIDKGEEYAFICPNPYHYDTVPSAYLNKKTLLFNCFGCSWSGNIITLISLVKEITREEAIQFLKNNNINIDENLQHKLIFDMKSTSLYKTKFKEKTESFKNLKQIPRVKDIDFSNELLKEFIRKRHISKEILIKYGVKATVDDLKILVPIIARKVLVGYEIRPLFKSFMKVINSSTKIKKYIFDLDLLERKKELFVCEGLMDCLSLKSRGYMNSTCTFGSELTKQQLELLSEFEFITVIPDSDEAGEHLVEQILMLESKSRIYRINLPGKDIDELEDKELFNVINNKIRI